VEFEISSRIEDFFIAIVSNVFLQSLAAMYQKEKPGIPNETHKQKN